MFLVLHEKNHSAYCLSVHKVLVTGAGKNVQHDISTD